MRPANYIISIVLVLLFVGCNRNDDSVAIKDYFAKFISKDEPTAVINFSKSDSLLIADIESQIEMDLCDHSNITGLILINGTEIRFPVYIIKKCDRLVPSVHNVVSIVINQNNEALVDDVLVPANTNIFKKVLNSTSEMMKREGRTHLIYFFEWDKQTTSTDLRNRLHQTFRAIQSYSDSLSIEKYSMRANKLNTNKFDTLKNKFVAKIGFRDYFPGLPPPPKSQKHQ